MDCPYSVLCRSPNECHIKLMIILLITNWEMVHKGEVNVQMLPAGFEVYVIDWNLFVARRSFKRILLWRLVEEAGSWQRWENEGGNILCSFMNTRRYGGLCTPTYSSCRGLRCSTKAFYGLFWYSLYYIKFLMYNFLKPFFQIKTKKRREKKSRHLPKIGI